MVCIAAAADLHFGPGSEGTLSPFLKDLGERAHILLLAGDLTQTGRPEEARVLAREIEGLSVPAVAVLGNHDYHSGCEDEIAEILEESGVRVLEGDTVEYEFDGATLGICGSKGFGGGFGGACATDFGEVEVKQFIRHTQELSRRLEDALKELDTDLVVTLLHYSPVRDTLVGEPAEIYPFLGSYLLGDAVDAGGSDLVLHGHAHRGTEKGETASGIPVRNVAQTVIDSAYGLYQVTRSRRHLETAAIG